jgi:hypothetical protein
MATLMNIFIYAGIVQGFYLALLLNHNKKRNVANQYLAALLNVMLPMEFSNLIARNKQKKRAEELLERMDPGIGRQVSLIGFGWRKTKGRNAVWLCKPQFY